MHKLIQSEKEQKYLNIKKTKKNSSDMPLVLLWMLVFNLNFFSTLFQNPGGSPERDTVAEEEEQFNTSPILYWITQPQIPSGHSNNTKKNASNTNTSHTSLLTSLNGPKPN